MTRGIYVERNLIAPASPEQELVDFDAQMAPIMLSAIGGRIGPSHYATRFDYLASWPRLALVAEGLLMGGVDRLVREIRALRNGINTPLATQDAQLDPYTLPLSALSQIEGNLSTNGKSAAFILEEIRLLQASANAGDAESQAELLRIGAIIAGAI